MREEKTGGGGGGKPQLLPALPEEAGREAAPTTGHELPHAVGTGSQLLPDAGEAGVEVVHQPGLDHFIHLQHPRHFPPRSRGRNRTGRSRSAPEPPPPLLRREGDVSAGGAGKAMGWRRRGREK